MSESWMFKVPLLIASALCNMLFALLFFILRRKAQNDILTKSQKWGLSLLGAVFLINALEIAGYAVLIFTTRGKYAYDDFQSFPLKYRIVLDLMHANSIVILGFGAVFPRPIFEWKRMMLIIGGVVTATFLVITVRVVAGNYREFSLLYLLSVYMFPIIWFRWCASERSDLCRKTLSLLSWGFIFGPMSQCFMNQFLVLRKGDLPDLTGDITLWLVMITSSLIAYDLWSHRQKWGSAERLNAVMLGLSVLAGFSLGAVIPFRGMPEVTWATNSPLSVFFILVNDSCWMLLRPILFSLALLRYQLFGTEVRAGVYFRLVGWACVLSIVTAMVQLAVLDAETTIQVGTACATALAGAYPIWLLVDRGMARLLPLGGRESEFKMSEKRDTYLISLQTAVVGGAVADSGDMSALGNLRKKLGISDREHNLMLTFFPKPDKPVTTTDVQELFLILQDGRLLAHAGKMGGDKELVAGMLSAIRGFVEEGLQGGSKELDAVKYGDYTLVMESEGKVVLAALVLGPESPDVRVLLRDTLAEAMRLRGDALKKWDGGSDKLKGLPELLGKALAPA